MGLRRKTVVSISFCLQPFCLGELSQPRKSLSSAKALAASMENLKAVDPDYFFNRQNVKS
jgi:hypothetical protein